MRPLGILIGASLAFGAAVLISARYALGDHQALQGLAGLAVCLVPAVLTLGLAGLVEQGTHEQRLLVFMGGSGLRLLGILGGGWLLTQSFPDFFTTAFWLWVFLFYTFTLSLEVVLLTGRHGPLASARLPDASPPRDLTNQAS